MKSLIYLNKDYYLLNKSTNPKKKYSITFLNDTGKIKTLNFGSTPYDDFLTHHDLSRVERYDKRHQKRENWSDPHTRGFWSKWLLWSSRADTLDEAIRQIENSFNIKIIKLF
jgi:hypothetical protein